MQLFELGADGNVAFTSTNVAITGSIQTITLNYPSRHIVINNIGTTNLFITLDGTNPTTASFEIIGGQSLAMDGLPAVGINSLKVLGSAAAGTVAVLAW
jgi:hypothetical protein